MPTPTVPARPIDYATPVTPVDAPRLFGRISFYLIPFMFLMYVVGYLDRINVGFAALTMKPRVGLSETAYGFGAGIFFIGYFLFEVPSNLILERVGARRWIARIMVSWGIIACAMMFIRGPLSFNGLRFLLGAAEAGFFPGMVLYLTYWFPAARRAQAMSSFLTGTAIAGVIGAPVSSMCLRMDGVGHLYGWQWLFLLEGIPSILLGIVVLFYLPDGPRQARWLSDAEKDWLDAHLHEQRSTGAHEHRHTLWDALRDGRLWLLSGIYFLLMIGLYGFSMWEPAIVKARAPGLSDVRITLLSAIPYAAAAIGMVLLGQNSDRTGERHKHIAVAAVLACIGMSLAAFARSPATTLSALSFAAVGIWGTLGTFWTLPTAFLRGTAAAGGIAIVNSLGCLAGFAAPFLMGWLKDQTHSFTSGLLVVAAAMLGAGVLVFAVRISRAASMIDR